MGHEKEFVVTEAQTHVPEPSVIPLSYPGAPTPTHLLKCSMETLFGRIENVLILGCQAWRR